MKTLIPFLLLFIACGSRPTKADISSDERILAYVVDPKTEDLRLFGEDQPGQPYGSLGALRDRLAAQGQRLVFAVNGGMYQPDHRPQGLFIEMGQVKMPLDTQQNGYGNFYLHPNGVFALDQTGNASITPTPAFVLRPDIQYATQSGPMLLIDGKLHPAFNEGSANLNIRNGVGILPDGRVLFAQSKDKINFYDFASYFRQQGCRNALYLDGVVSRTYCPALHWEQLDGEFAVIIGVVE